MERHIKQQHPDVWSTRPRGHRRSASVATPVKAAPAPSALLKEATPAAAVKAPPASDSVRNAIAQQLKLKRSVKNESDDAEDGADDAGDDDEYDEDDDVDDDEEHDAGALVIDEAKDGAATAAATVTSSPVTASSVTSPVTSPSLKTAESADLASVSKLLNNAVAQNFQQYFRPEAASAASSVKGGHGVAESDDVGTDADDAECTSSDAQSNSDDAGQQHGDDAEQVSIRSIQSIETRFN